MKLSRHTRKAIVRALQNEDDSIQELFIETLMQMGLAAEEINYYKSEANKYPRKERIQHDWRLKGEN